MSEISGKDAIPWLIVVLGWLVGHLLSESRERRKEVRAQIDRVRDYVFDLEDEARVFFLAEKYNSSLALKIIALIQNLEHMLSHIQIFSGFTYSQHLVVLRQAITLHNFDHHNFTQQAEDSEILGGISVATMTLCNHLESKYNERYPNRFPFFRLDIMGKLGIRFFWQ